MKLGTGLHLCQLDTDGLHLTLSHKILTFKLLFLACLGCPRALICQVRLSKLQNPKVLHCKWVKASWRTHLWNPVISSSQCRGAGPFLASICMLHHCYLQLIPYIAKAVWNFLWWSEIQMIDVLFEVIWVFQPNTWKTWESFSSVGWELSNQLNLPEGSMMHLVCSTSLNNINWHYDKTVKCFECLIGSYKWWLLLLLWPD